MTKLAFLIAKVAPQPTADASDLELKLRSYADRGYTLGAAVPQNMLADVLAGFGGRVDRETPLVQVLEIKA